MSKRDRLLAELTEVAAELAKQPALLTKRRRLVRVLLQDHGMSQVELAGRIGVSQSALAHELRRTNNS